MLSLTILLIGGLSGYVGIQGIRKLHKGDSQLDNKYQKFIQTKIDPFIGEQREQQLPALSSQTEEEKRINREVGIATANCALAVVCQLVYPPLLIATVPAIIFFGLSSFKDSYDAIFTEKRITVALLDAILISWTVLSGYWFAAALSIFLVRVSLKILSRVKDNSRKNMIEVFTLRSQSVWVWTGEAEVQVSIHDVRVGDTVVVSASEVIPVDGRISKGAGLIDQQGMTGEVQPAEKARGDSVFASTVVLSGKIFIEVEQAGETTVVAQIGQLLNQTAEYKTVLESSTERLVDQSVLPTLLLSGLAFPVAGTSGSLAILIASVGYPLRMLAPLSTLNFLHIASQAHILLKDGHALETLAQVDTVVFDKTGTLTLDQPQVAKIHVWQRAGQGEACYDEATLLAYAAAAESRHTHPIARAIVATATAQGLTLPTVEDSTYTVGYGIKVRLDSRELILGSSRFMQAEHIVIAPDLLTLQTESHSQGHSLIMLAIDGELVGAIELQATVRPGVKQVVEWLHQQDITTVIISGDHAQPTAVLATELGIDRYFAETLPQEKAAVIAEMQQQGKTICYVGDGINDAIALKQADISVSLSGATTAAIDTAQVILMNKGLTPILELFNLARQFKHNQQRNFLISVVPNALCIAGVFLFGFGLYTAIALFNGSILVGIVNAMQPLLNRPPKQESEALEIETRRSPRNALVILE